jgi:hypothetical protein
MTDRATLRRRREEIKRIRRDAKSNQTTGDYYTAAKEHDKAAGYYKAADELHRLADTLKKMIDNETDYARP